MNFVRTFISNLRVLALVLLLAAACETPRVDPGNRGQNARINTNVAATPEPLSTERVEDKGMGSPLPELSPLPPDAPGVRAAIGVVQQYYKALNSRDYRKAYGLWSGKGEASGKSFEEFRSGFSETVSTEIDTSGEPGTPEGAAGSQYIAIPGIITAKTTDGKTQKFWGEYVMRRSMVDGATAEQREWRIYSAKFRQL